MEIVLGSVAAVVAVCLVLIVMSAVLVAAWTLIKKGAAGIAGPGAESPPGATGSFKAGDKQGSEAGGGGESESD